MTRSRLLTSCGLLVIFGICFGVSDVEAFHRHRNNCYQQTNNCCNGQYGQSDYNGYAYRRSNRGYFGQPYTVYYGNNGYQQSGCCYASTASVAPAAMTYSAPQATCCGTSSAVATTTNFAPTPAPQPPTVSKPTPVPKPGL